MLQSLRELYKRSVQKQGEDKAQRLSDVIITAWAIEADELEELS